MNLGLVNILSTSFDNLKRIIPKFIYRGQKDIQTSFQVGPPQTDANPIKGMAAIYGETNVDGSTMIIGYIQTNCLSKPGEHRIFSTTASGTLKTYIWLKDTGIIEIAGNVDNAVRYAQLNAGLQQEVLAINAELAKIATAINAIIPGLYVPQPISLNITASKINEIKTT